jgi:crotonobetainyl-CoA:carnitine CoA-transferase CaiB-like acyl-CoA transferase
MIGDGCTDGPLAGIKVVEFGSTVAAPFCCRLFADFGADVIKVEPPEGDVVRWIGPRQDGVGLYGTSILRNKRLVALDLKRPEALAMARRLAERADIVVENFRPGTLERLGLGYENLVQSNPGLVLVRISGFGQSGPYRGRAGYGVVAEAMAGVRHMTGDPDRPPSRVGVAMTDQLTAVYAAFAAMMALRRREATGRGQVVDAALYECSFSLMEPYVPAYEKAGLVPIRAGSGLSDSAPNNLYPTEGGGYVHIAANGDAVFNRLMESIGRAELAASMRYQTAADRGANKDELDGEIAAWTSRHSAAEVEQKLVANGVPASRVFTIEDIFADEHYRARDMLPSVPHPALGSVTMAGVAPKLSESPGTIRWAGGRIGEHTEAVLRQDLGVDTATIERLCREKAIVCANAPVPAG